MLPFLEVRRPPFAGGKEIEIGLIATVTPRSWATAGASVLTVVRAWVPAVLRFRRGERRSARRALEERLRFETLLSELSAGLIHVPASGLDDALTLALRRVVPVLGADRGALDEQGGAEPSPRIAWAASGVGDVPRMLDVDEFPWSSARLREGEIVRFSRAAELPNAASTDRASFLRADTRSHVSLPLGTNGRMLGVLLFESVRDERVWSDEVVERLGLLRDVFARALERRRTEVSLADRLVFEQLLSSLSTTFSIMTGADFDRELERGLHRIAHAFHLDHGGLIEFSRDGQASRTWTLDGSLTAEHLPWMAARLQRGHVIDVSPVDELPDEAAVDRRSLRARGLRWSVGLPLVVGGTVVGGLVFGAGRGESARPPDDLLPRLRLLAEVFANILARKQGELESQRLRQEMAHVGRISAMGELTASIAHELNQPLTAILNNARVAQRLLASEVVDVAQVREILSDIATDDKRAADVILRLRRLLRKGDLEYTVLDLNEVATEVARLVTSDAAIRDVPLRVELAAAVPRVRGDRVQLQQVVLNLVLNGLDAMRESPGDRSLVIRTFSDGTSAAGISVRDAGTGIAASDIGNIFEPLFTTKAEGLGMGLAISRTIIQAHGGRLTATNNDDGGATFQFTLPGAQAAPR